MSEPVQKPGIYPCDGMNFFHSISGFERLKDGEEPLVILFFEPLTQRRSRERHGIQRVK